VVGETWKVGDQDRCLLDGNIAGVHVASSGLLNIDRSRDANRCDRSPRLDADPLRDGTVDDCDCGAGVDEKAEWPVRSDVDGRAERSTVRLERNRARGQGTRPTSNTEHNGEEGPHAAGRSAAGRLQP